jgi:hypothetical protein
MTNEQILTAEGDELSRLLGEVLQAAICQYHGKHPPCQPCNTCSTWVEGGIRKCKPDPIPLTPDEAFKWRDWAVAEYGIGCFYGVLWDMFDYFEPIFREELKEHLFVDTLISCMTAKQYLQAAAICKLNKEQSNG